MKMEMKSSNKTGSEIIRMNREMKLRSIQLLSRNLIREKANLPKTKTKRQIGQNNIGAMRKSRRRETRTLNLIIELLLRKKWKETQKLKHKKSKKKTNKNSKIEYKKQEKIIAIETLNQ